MEGKTYGFAIVGCGVISKLHAKAIATLPNARLEAVVDVEPERAKALADQEGVRALTDVADALALPAVDVVSVCVPTGLHAEIGIRAAQAGKHVVCEKPIDVSLEAADRLIEACREAGVQLTVISQRRFEPSIKRLKQLIDERQLGEVILGGARLKWYRSQEYYDSGAWRGTWALDGGGALMNQGVHYVDLLRWLLGPVRSIRAVCATKAHERIEVEDIALAILEFTSGALATIDAATAVYPGLPERVEITGTKGTAVLESGALALVETLDEKQAGVDPGAGEQLSAAADPTRIPAGGHIAQLGDFLHAVDTGSEPFVTGADGRAAIEVILSVYEAARQGGAFELPVSGKAE